uniref:Uncharacterized protein n=1 Tax=Anolis carolinensis TaxID=28377 RepID=A0A803SUJ4_ANOCA
MLPEGGPQPPKGLRHHSCLIVGAFVDAVCNDLYVHDAQSSPGKWFRFLSSNRALKRIRQWTCLLNDKLYLVAGFWVQRSAPWRYPYEVHVFRIFNCILLHTIKQHLFFVLFISSWLLASGGR